MTHLSVDDQVGMEATVQEFLDAVCNIERPQLVTDGMGQRERTWLQVATGVPCRLHRTDKNLRTDENRIRVFGSSALTVPKTTDIRIGDRVNIGTALWLVDTNPVPFELSLVVQVSLVVPEGAQDPDAIAASAITFTPGGTISSTNVQEAIDELALEATLFERGSVLVNDSGLDLMDVVLWRAPYACTVLATRAYRVGGTGAIVRFRKGALPLNVSDLSMVASETWVVGTDIINGTFAPGDALVLELIQVTGTVTEVTMQAELQRG